MAKSNRGFFGLLFDLILGFCTMGIWWVWILLKYLRNNS